MRKNGVTWVSDNDHVEDMNEEDRMMMEAHNERTPQEHNMTIMERFKEIEDGLKTLKALLEDL